MFQIAIVKVLYEIRLLSGKSYWKYGCKWRWFVRSLNWCVDSGKLWILDIEVLGKVDISNCHRRLWQRIRQVDYKMYTWEIPQGLWKRSATHNAIFLKLVTALLLWVHTMFQHLNSTCDVCFIMSQLIQKYDILRHWLRVEE